MRKLVEQLLIDGRSFDERSGIATRGFLFDAILAVDRSLLSEVFFFFIVSLRCALVYVVLEAPKKDADGSRVDNRAHLSDSPVENYIVAK